MSTMMIPGQTNMSYGGMSPYYGGGGIGSQSPFQRPYNGGEYQQTLPDAQTGGGHLGWRSGIFGGPTVKPNEGYGLDFNRNGRYDRGQDGVLVFDTNKDGKYDKKDVQGTNNMMQAATGNYDFDNNGKVSLGERLSGGAARARFAKLDTNRDGKLSTDEISRGGGKVWMDESRGGGVSQNELHSAYNVPSNGRFGPTERVDFVDPFSRTSHTTPNQGWNSGPWGGGGYPGGGGGYPGGGCGCPSHGGGQPQYGNYGGQPQYGNYGGQPQYGNYGGQPQYGAQPQYGNYGGGYSGY